MRRDPIHVLLIEDDEVDATQVRRTLRDEPGRFQLHWVTTLQEGLDHLGKGEVDAVLLDLNLPDSRGVETVVRLRERAPSLPIVVLTVAIELRIAIGSLQAGAQASCSRRARDLVGADARDPYAIERQKIAYEQRRLEERVARAEKMAILGVLAAGVAQSLQRTVWDDPRGCGAALERARSREIRRVCRRSTPSASRRCARAACRTSCANTLRPAAPMRRRSIFPSS